MKLGQLFSGLVQNASSILGSLRGNSDEQQVTTPGFASGSSDSKAINHLTSTIAANRTTATAWPSKYPYDVHQESVRRVLKGSLSSQDLKSVVAAVKEADKSEWQAVGYSYRHAMTPAGWSKADAREQANRFVRAELDLARTLEARGDRNGAMYHLGLAMHCLQDSTSPAHHGFREYKGGNAELASHMYEELFDPDKGSQLDEATKRAYLYFKGTLPMPDDFFAGLGYDEYKK